MKIKNSKIVLIEIPKIKIEKRKVVQLTITIVLLNNGVIVAHAQSIAESFMPLVRVFQDLAEPVSYGFMIKGFLQIMAGESTQGSKTIKNAIGGFVGIQFIPKIFSIIRNIKF